MKLSNLLITSLIASASAIGGAQAQSSNSIEDSLKSNSPKKVDLMSTEVKKDSVQIKKKEGTLEVPVRRKPIITEHYCPPCGMG